MSKATAYTLSLIQKAKEVAFNNKILKRQRDKKQLDEALEYVYKHLDEWYSSHIDRMKRYDHLQPLYFCITDMCDNYMLYLGENKWYKYSVYKFRVVKYEHVSVIGSRYLEVYVNG
jgi:hypothetical protein